MTSQPVYIPISPNSKRPLPSAARWQTEDFTPDWENVPDDVNKALRLDGLVVVDTDTPDAEAWWREHGQATDVVVRTPSGGAHFYYRLPEGAEALPAGAVRWPDGTPAHIDIKTGPGHYVLAPGSEIEGRAYRLAQGHDFDPYKAPGLSGAAETTIRALKPPKAVSGQQEPGNGASGATGVDKVPSGARHDTFVALTGLMRRLGWSDGLVGRVLNGVNQQLTEEGPIPQDELYGIIASTEKWLEPDIELVDEAEVKEGATATILDARNMVIPPPAEWLWKPYLPEGRLVLLDGREGIGKGMFAAWAAVKITSGAWGPKASVLWLSAEDDPEEDILKRLRATGWAPENGHDTVWFLNPDVWPSFPDHIDAFETEIVERGVRLMVIDPGRSYIKPPDGVKHSFNDEAAVRPALQALQRLARRTGCTILFVHHWNKDSEGSTRTRAGGSGAFTQVVRHRISVAKAGTDEAAEWAMAVTKTNIGTEGHLVAYRLEAVPAYDTARFVEGQAIRGYASLDAWHKDRHKELEESVVDHESVVLMHLEQLESGAVVPNFRQLSKDSGVPERKVQGVLKALQDEGKITVRKGVPSTWNG